MTAWVAIGYGALDVRGLSQYEEAGIEQIVISTVPAEPMGMAGDAAALWRRLVRGVVDDDVLTSREQGLVREFSDYGIASADTDHRARLHDLPAPWFVSPLHELVTSLVVSLARDLHIDAVVIKGQALSHQGLRTKRHSADVDFWVDPQKLAPLVEALHAWGWTLQSEIWMGTTVNHSLTAEPGTWGCEIDLHRRFPGCGDDDLATFHSLLPMTEEATFAGIPARVPRMPAHAVILALHYLRPRFGQGETNPSRVEWAEDALRQAGPEGLVAAAELQAVSTLREVIEAVHPHTEIPSAEALPVNWVWLGRKTRLGGYMTAMRMVPLSRRPVIVWRMLWPSADVVRLSDRLARAESRSILRARVKRAERGLRDFFRPRR
jgi:hypothetical protein